MRQSLAVALLVLAGLSACADGTAPARGLDARAQNTELLEGHATPLSVTLDGELVDADEVQWISRDPVAVEVIRSVAHARSPGITWLVARVGALSDSVRVGVRFTALGANMVGVIIGGEIDRRFALGGASMMFELPNARAATIVHATAGRPAHADPDDIFAGDTVLSIRVSDAPIAGVRTLPPFVVADVAEGGFEFHGSEGVMMTIHEQTATYGATTYFVAVTDSPIEFTTVEQPAEAGVDHGTLAGRMAFDAAGFRIVYPYPTDAHSPPPQPYMEQLSERTMRIYVEFSTDWYRVPVPFSRLDVAGTPYSGSESVGGTARMRDGTLEIHQDALFNFRQPNERYIQATASVAAPAVGTFEMGTTAARLNASFSIFQRTNPDLNSGDMVLESTAAARSGTVTITEYRAPTDRAYGLVVGTYTAVLDFGAAHPEYDVTVTSNFRIPIDPLLGVPTDMTR